MEGFQWFQFDVLLPTDISSYVNNSIIYSLYALMDTPLVPLL
jgi:hypothetical protein